MTEPIDVFYEWLDACEAEKKKQQATEDPLGARLGRPSGFKVQERRTFDKKGEGARSIGERGRMHVANARDCSL